MPDLPRELTLLDDYDGSMIYADGHPVTRLAFQSSHAPAIVAAFAAYNRERSPWTAFSDAMPDEHRTLLVTNNMAARTAQGRMSHVWFVDGVHRHETAIQDERLTYAEAGEVTAFSESDMRLRGLTHWRYALPEEG